MTDSSPSPITPEDEALTVQDRMIFIISPPRAGSTLLQRMLASHADILTHPEPHIITPLAHLGYFRKVDKAPYDHINSATAIRLFVEGLPQGEADYYDAVRAYTDVLYGRMLTKKGKARFLDKTPAYALVLPFLAKLYPRARYVVLTRHPLAVFSSYAESFFEGQWETAHQFNPILERYVPAISEFLRGGQTRRLHVRYEALVTDPRGELDKIFAFLGLVPDPKAVEYGSRFEGKTAGPGDPIGVAQHRRPVTDSLERWAAEVAADPGKRRLAEEMCARLSDVDLATWGSPRTSLFDPLMANNGPPPKPRPKNKYTLQRKVFLALRKNIHHRPHGALLKRVQYYCDVLLRE